MQRNSAKIEGIWGSKKVKWYFVDDIYPLKLGKEGQSRGDLEISTVHSGYNGKPRSCFYLGARNLKSHFCNLQKELEGLDESHLYCLCHVS